MHYDTKWKFRDTKKELIKKYREKVVQRSSRYYGTRFIIFLQTEVC